MKIHYTAFRRLRILIVYGLLGFLLYLALRHASLGEIWSALQRLKLWQIVLVIGIDLFIYTLTTARWWVIIRAEYKNIEYLHLIPVRIAVFGISYFTLGPQIGGEPLQVLYLQRKHGLTYTHATAAVVMDKLIEFLADFILLVFGLTALIEAGFLSTPTGISWPGLLGLAFLVTWPLIHIILLYHKIHPVSNFIQILPFKKVKRFITALEKLAGNFCRRHPSSLVKVIFLSILATIGMVSEYFLMTSFLGINLSFWQTVAAWTSGWLSFLMPLPGGLGALEASQVFALGFFGIPAASALGVTLLMRGRDLLTGGLGLLFAGRVLHGNDQ